MIGFQNLLFIVGVFLDSLALSMVAPAVVDWIYDDINWRAFVISASLTGFSGLLLTLANRPLDRIALSIRDTFLLTVLSWTILSFFSALPFLFSYSTASLTDSFFEAVSGLTTTGATVMIGIDFTSPGIILWRSILQWLGGVGIIVMALTVMPILRIGGMQLFRSESSDRSEKILPRVSQIASAILSLYLIFTVLCGVALWVAGLKPLEAICHSFSVLSTGGFSSSDASVGYFNNPLAEAIMMVFMVVGSIPFVLFIRAFQGQPRALLRDAQVRTFLTLLLVSILSLTIWQYYHGDLFLTALRQVSFNVVSVMTTTGFVTTDYALWGSFPVMALLIFMHIGGCTGSTSGSIKVFRYKIMFAVVRTHIAQLRRPHGVFIPKYNHQPIPEGVFTSVFTFFGLYIFCFALLSLGLALHGLDIMTCLSGAITALNNVGPGFGPVIGPTGSFALLPTSAKWLLMAGMLLGRLEYFAILILFTPNFWRN